MMFRQINVIKIIVFMTKKKAHLPNTKQTGGLFSMLSWISIFDSKIPCKIRISKELKRNKHKL